jgi:hypothetical protein
VILALLVGDMLGILFLLDEVLKMHVKKIVKYSTVLKFQSRFDGRSVSHSIL